MREAVRAALADLAALQRRPETIAARSDTKTGSDQILVKGRVLPALDRLLALLAMLAEADESPEREAAESGVTDILGILTDASEALYDVDAKRAVQTVLDRLTESR